MNEPQDLSIDGWTVKLRVPDGSEPHPVIFLIHGWTGDERSMWVFAQRLPKNALLISPRAPYISKHPEFAGYSWVENRGQGFSSLADFRAGITEFGNLTSQVASITSGDFKQFAMVGFSQGAAFCIAYALQYPERVTKLALLAGFLPSGSDSALATQLKGLPVFIAHGTKDETVPVDKARQAKHTLERAGAHVQYCESDTGHKLGANCGTELSKFFLQ